ncbi:flavin reductase family protein [Nocardia sp. NPDC052254]|uniref:flavin reductase family protein n=1 Tax=Nocardia sp. NPDC052254 TaxID=3155681 RepID=UPI00341EB3D1
MTMPGTRILRDVLGHFGSGVTIVTAVHDGVPTGFTCQSFSALSLAPPKVLLCPSRTSTSWPLIRTAPTFAVNVLSAAQCELSDRFARSGGHKFGDIGWQSAPGGAPILDGVAAWFELALDTEHPGGDHTVVIADILEFAAGGTSEPLIFSRGKYCGVIEFDHPDDPARRQPIGADAGGEE